MLAQVGDEIAAVLGAGVAARAQRAAAEPQQPVAGGDVEVLAEAQFTQSAAPG